MNNYQVKDLYVTVKVGSIMAFPEKWTARLKMLAVFSLFACTCTFASYALATSEDGKGAAAFIKSESKLKTGDKLENFGLRRLVEKPGTSPMVFLDQYVGPGVKDSANLLLLSFFASWCEPCKEELPEIRRLAGEHTKRGLRVVMINIDDTKEGISQVEAFCRKENMSFPVVSDRFHIVARRFFGDQLPLPANFLVNSKSEIVFARTGGGDKMIAELEAELQSRLVNDQKKPADNEKLNNSGPETVKVVDEKEKGRLEIGVSKVKRHWAWVPIGKRQGVRKSMSCSFITAAGDKGQCEVIAIAAKLTRVKTKRQLSKGDTIVFKPSAEK